MTNADYRKPINLLRARAKSFKYQCVKQSKVKQSFKHLSSKALNYKTALLQEAMKQRCHRKFFRKSSPGYYYPAGAIAKLFSPVKELYLGGGGGKGRASPFAIYELSKYGLDSDNLTAITTTSVGSILGLMLYLGMPIYRTRKVLNEMPTGKFQDWDYRSAFSILTKWGFCSGNVMENYFRRIIEKTTGLRNPTFRQLYRAGYKKEFRIVIANVTQGRVNVFSYKKTPNRKVAECVALACSVPLFFRPKWLKNARGELELFTDGGIINNYPFGVGAPKKIKTKNQLGIMYADDNVSAIINKNGKQQTLLTTLWAYICSLFNIFMVHSHLSLPKRVQNRTAAVNVHHKWYKFSASLKEQQALDLGGKRAARDLVKRILDRKLKKLTKKIKFSGSEKNPIIYRSLTPTFENCRNKNKNHSTHGKNRAFKISSKHSQILRCR